MKSVFIFLLFFIVANLSAQSTCPGPDWENISFKVFEEEYFSIGEKWDTTFIYSWAELLPEEEPYFVLRQGRPWQYIRYSWCGNRYFRVRVTDRQGNLMKIINIEIHVILSDLYIWQTSNHAGATLEVGKLLSNSICRSGSPIWYIPQVSVQPDSLIESYQWKDGAGNIVGTGASLKTKAAGKYTVTAAKSGCNFTRSFNLYPNEDYVQEENVSEVLQKDVDFEISTPKRVIGFSDALQFDICLENKDSNWFPLPVYYDDFPFQLEFQAENDTTWQFCGASEAFWDYYLDAPVYLYPLEVWHSMTPQKILSKDCSSAYLSFVNNIKEGTCQKIQFRIRKKVKLSYDTEVEICSKPLETKVCR